ncbi:MAG: septum formation inhibitor Maf [Candidatus Sedimenticola endophacoides]|uniref:7-methyl-GTP pyrophosphatase n=1 Tax=Candidatus Sedimenticola endophacoides TaxID=2548426 RepID=A0A6N4DKW7_9GAMM|nr:MAG: septum formation inhibitor Maf [Candidatus Sedimenticola endophacoides]OQX36251.1 MAG: septum formation inhibitor Maf [Candidatus Sedimenticola endophacoides]OQX39890.1 MAG: septum formation inhibitor Maf [Candidatus Sedimenticola endophacoides]OQX43984.1 MAG: septum formation inhibitor Maf [Candidatus Sedimenticola endophacoides]PUD98239.1 MAG: septum formation inhibitor Maf [Candidatus Sedimenticola endophacoides]
MNSTDALSHPPHLPLVLGSTSPFRREILAKLGLAFRTAAPEIDESRRAGESPRELVSRLALEKARAVADAHPQSLVIGSDQVACNGGEILGKPGDRTSAIAQLSNASGRVVSFYTGLCLLNTASGGSQVVCDPFHVHFRQLSMEQIERYLDIEQPYNCAGSFKSEGLGISLFTRLEGDDPNSLIGLPLIRLIEMLEAEGIHLP